MQKRGPSTLYSPLSVWAPHAYRPMPSGSWVRLPNEHAPPYPIEHLPDAHRARVEGCMPRWPGLFKWGWQDAEEAVSDVSPSLLKAEELCERMGGLNTLFIGDS